mgnify:CR=1 FL=1
MEHPGLDDDKPHYANALRHHLQTAKTLRRQAAQRQREAAQPEVEYVRKVEAGSGFEALEREIVRGVLGSILGGGRRR